MQTLNPYLSPILDELDQYLDQHSLCNEHQLIKHLQDKAIEPFHHFSLSESTDLFSAHFLCMHALYHLKNQYQAANQFTLIIESVRVERIPFSSVDDAKTNASATDDTNSRLEVVDPLEQYYLNSSHYFETQADEINDMITSFWQKYIALNEKQQALDTLNLPMNADAKMIKTRYLSLAQKHHPDKGGCAETFNNIGQAKAILDKLY